MRRSLVLTLGLVLLAACSREHGDAPKGTYAPGGPIDDRGNAATSRARGPDTPPSAEAPAAYVEPGAMAPERIANSYDAGAVDQAPAPEQIVSGTIVAIEGQQISIAPDAGQPISLLLDEAPDITLGGALVSQGDLREGAQVRASFRTEDGARVAGNIEVLRTPEEGRGLWQEALTPAAP